MSETIACANGRADLFDEATVLFRALHRLRNDLTALAERAGEPGERLRTATCSRFTTVLGPGSDGYHENHIHMDLAERTRGYRMCQWDVLEPSVLVNVPLPVPRPTAQIEAEEEK